MGRQPPQSTVPVVALVVVLVVGPVAGAVGPSPGVAVQEEPGPEQDQPPWAEGLFRALQNATAAYNDRVDEVDTYGLSRNQLRNERVNLHVTDGNGSTANFTFRLGEEANVTSLEPGSHPDPTVRIRATRDAAERVAATDDELRVLGEALRADEVRVEGVGFANEVKWRLVTAILERTL